MADLRLPPNLSLGYSAQQVKGGACTDPFRIHLLVMTPCLLLLGRSVPHPQKIPYRQFLSIPCD